MLPWSFLGASFYSCYIEYQGNIKVTPLFIYQYRVGNSHQEGNFSRKHPVNTPGCNTLVLPTVISWYDQRSIVWMNTFVIPYHNFLGQLQSDFPHLDISAGHNRTQSTQALIQLGVLVMTLFAAIIGGALTGNIDVICTKTFTKNATTLICTCTSHNQNVW